MLEREDRDRDLWWRRAERDEDWSCGCERATSDRDLSPESDRDRFCRRDAWDVELW